MTPPLELGPAGEKRCKAWESCARWDAGAGLFVPYRDVVRKWTIGWGHLITPLELQMLTFRSGLTQAGCDALFRADAAPRVAAINRGLREDISGNAFNALFVLGYNIGIEGLLTSTVLKLINAAAPREQIVTWWMAWNKVIDPETGKKVANAGLTNRRRDELALFFAPDDAPPAHYEPTEDEKAEHKTLELAAPTDEEVLAEVYQTGTLALGDDPGHRIIEDKG